MAGFSEIIITKDALNLIERILASCVTNGDFGQRVRLISVRNMADLFGSAPVPASELFQTLRQKGAEKITREIVIESFSGRAHMEAIEEWAKNPNQIIASTGQSFLKRVRDLGINYEQESNEANFNLLDLAAPCQITTRKHRLVDVRLSGKTISNCVLPPGFDLAEGDWTLCHMGAIISALNKKEAERILQTQETFDILESIRSITTDAIDCRNFCPSAPGKKDGFNLTAWVLGRLP